MSRINLPRSVRTCLAVAGLSLALGACSGTRELGPTYFIDADRTDYIEDGRDFPELGKYGQTEPKVMTQPNVLDMARELPELPEKIRAWRARNDQPAEDPAALSDPVDENAAGADAPSAKPGTPAVAPASPSDIAKSLVGDLSSIQYTDEPLRGDVAVETDDILPAPVRRSERFRIVPREFDYIAQAVEPEADLTRRVVIDSAMRTGSDSLDRLRMETYRRKLAESSARDSLLMSGQITFDRPRTPDPVVPARQVASAKPDLAAPVDRSVAGPMIVLARISEDGLISALSPAVAVAGRSPPPARTVQAGLARAAFIDRPVRIDLAALDH